MASRLVPATQETCAINPLLMQHLQQDLGIPLNAIVKAEEGSMSAEAAVLFVSEAQRLIRFVRSRGEFLTSSYIHGDAQYFFNTADARPPSEVAPGSDAPPEVAEGDAAPPEVAEGDAAPPEAAARAVQNPRAHGLLAAVAQVVATQPDNACDMTQVAPNNAEAKKLARAVGAGPKRVVYRGQVVPISARVRPAPAQRPKAAAGVKFHYVGTQTHIVGERRQRMRFTDPAVELPTAGSHLRVERGVPEDVGFIDVSLLVEQELPLSVPDLEGQLPVQ